MKTSSFLLPLVAFLVCTLCFSCEKNDTDINALFRRWDFRSQERLSITDPDGPNHKEQRDFWNLDEENRFFKFHSDYTVDSHAGPGMFRIEGDLLSIEFYGQWTTYQYRIRSRELTLINTRNEPGFREELTFKLRAN